MAPRAVMIDDARGRGAADGAGGQIPVQSAAAALPPAATPTSGGVRGAGGGTPVGARVGAAVGGVRVAAGTPGTSDEVLEVCPCVDCEVVLPGGVGSAMGLTHLQQHHLLRDVPTATAAQLQLEGRAGAAGRSGR